MAVAMASACFGGATAKEGRYVSGVRWGAGDAVGIGRGGESDGGCELVLASAMADALRRRWRVRQRETESERGERSGLQIDELWPVGHNTAVPIQKHEILPQKYT
jgi:hypothetical protein